MAWAGEKKDPGRGDQAGAAQPGRPAGDQPGPAPDVMTKGGPGPAEPGPPWALLRREMGASHPPRPVLQAEPVAVARPARKTPASALTEPIPVIRVPRPGEPPREGPASGGPAQDATPAEQAAAQEAPAAQMAAQPSAPGGVAGRAAARQAGQAIAGLAAVDQASVEQAVADQAAAGRAAARRAADEAAVQRTARLLARPSSGLNRRLVGLAAGSLLVIGGVTAAAVFLASGGHRSHLASPNSVAAVVVNRDHATAWVARQVSPGAMVSCDPVTCAVLKSRGFPASHVRALEAGKDTPLSSDLVVITPALRHQFGARLTRVYAPGLLASFGSGSQQVDIRIVAPRGVPAYQAGLRADLQNRQKAGAGLSGSNRIQAPAAARQQLAAGQVDPRLIVTLALMASLHHPLHLVAFGDGGPDPAAAPFRSVQLSLAGRAQKQSLLAFLGHQRPPYQPAHVTTRRTGQDRTILIMEFAAPSPVGLLH